MIIEFNAEIEKVAPLKKDRSYKWALLSGEDSVEAAVEGFKLSNQSVAVKVTIETIDEVVFGSQTA